jgi:hypothetical protein
MIRQRYHVMGWLARMVQQPDTQGEVALVLRGEKGAGKGTLGKWLLRLYGQHGVHISQGTHLTGKFNAHLRDAIFVFADEAFFAGDKANEGALKSLITEPYLTVEAKHQNAVTVKNMTHILMASNSDWVVPASGKERRFCVMDVSNDRLQDIPYFAELDEQAENGGLAAMLYDLLKHDISNFNFRSVPETEALSAQKQLSLESLDEWWHSVLSRGFAYRSRHGAEIFSGWHEFLSTELLYQSYLQWCRDTNARHPKTNVQLGKMMKAMYKGHRPRGMHPVHEIEVTDPNERKPAAMQERPPGYVVGTLDEARAAFARKTGISFDWGDDEAADSAREEYEL